ncbi:MAG: putative baseplate assembly protein [Acidobacteriota bacterium]
MPLKAPQLDTRSFDDLLSEARRRIPRYTPEWTDFNPSDPGMTLIELYAWLSEMMLYQMNRVPERNYIKFLQLLDLELRPAQPATAYLTFSGNRSEPIAKGAQLVAQQRGGGAPLVFETEFDLTLVRGQLSKVVVFDGRAFTDVSAANGASGVGFRPLGWVPQVGSALYLGFEPPRRADDGPLFPQEMRWRVGLPSADANPDRSCQTQRCGAPPPPPPVTLEWEYKARRDDTRWQRLNVLADDSIAFTREGSLLLEGPEDIEPSRVGRVQEDLYWLRCRVESGSYPEGNAPEIDFLIPNTVRAVNLTTVGEEVVGRSEGVPDQTFELAERPVQAGSLELAVEGADGELEPWTAVDDLLASGPDDPHYVLNVTTGAISFGDGSRGRIPTAGVEIIARQYRHGGGTAGNVGAGVIKRTRGELVGVEKLSNLRPAFGGRDEQEVEDLKRRAPQVLRHRNRAVTAEDFAALAAEMGGVAEATAVPLAHPDYPGVEVPGAVTVVVVPDHDDYPPRASDALIEYVCRGLESHRLLTTEVYVKGAEFQSIQVLARVSAPSHASADAVARDVALALDDYLSPRRWRFGQDLYPTSFYDVLLDVADVVAVDSLQLRVDGRPHDILTQRVVVPADGLVYGIDHEIVVRPAEDR